MPLFSVRRFHVISAAAMVFFFSFFFVQPAVLGVKYRPWTRFLYIIHSLFNVRLGNELHPLALSIWLLWRSFRRPFNGRTPERLLTGLTMGLDVIGRDDQIELNEGEHQCTSSPLFARFMIDDGCDMTWWRGLVPFPCCTYFEKCFAALLLPPPLPVVNLLTLLLARDLPWTRPRISLTI